MFGARESREQKTSRDYTDILSVKSEEVALSRRSYLKQTTLSRHCREPNMT